MRSCPALRWRLSWRWFLPGALYCQYYGVCDGGARDVPPKVRGGVGRFLLERIAYQSGQKVVELLKGSLQGRL